MMNKVKVIGVLFLVFAVCTLIGMLIENAEYWRVYNYLTLALSVYSGIALLTSKQPLKKLSFPCKTTEFRLEYFKLNGPLALRHKSLAGSQMVRDRKQGHQLNWQSRTLLMSRSQVRLLHGPPFLYKTKYAGYKIHP